MSLVPMPPLDDDDDDTLQLSSDSSAGSSPVIPKLSVHDTDDISKDLAELEQLRRSVQKNLRLRPIRSRGCLPKIDVDELGIRMPGAFPLSAALQTAFDIDSPTASPPASDKHTTATTPTAKAKAKGPPPALTINAHAGPSRSTVNDGQEILIPPLLNIAMSPLSATSPTSSILSSYFTPAGETPVTSRFGMFKGYNTREAAIEEEESSTDRGWHLGSVTNSTSATACRDGEMTMVSSPMDATFNFTGPSGSTLTDNRPQPQPIPASELYARLSPLYRSPSKLSSSLKRNAGRGRPILIDTRAPAAHVAYRIRGSMNVAIPSLILKRCRKITASGILREEAVTGSTNNLGLGGGVSKGGLQSLDVLRQFVVGEKAKAEWNVMLQSRRSDGPETEEGLRWDGDIIVFDEEMEQDIGGTAWILMEVLKPLVNANGGRVDYLEGGIMKGVKDAELKSLVEFGPIRGSHTNGTTGDEPSLSIGAKRSATGGLFKLDIAKRLPEIETSTSSISSTSTSRSNSTSTSLSSTPASPGPLSIPRSPLSIIPPSLTSKRDSDKNTSSMTDTNTNAKQETLKTTITNTIPAPLLSGSFNLHLDASPSPPPSYITFRLPQANPSNNGNVVGGLRAKRPSVPNLRRIDTKSAERLNPNLPKLSVRTKPVRSATLTIPPRLTLPGSSMGSFGLPPPTSPSHLDLMYSSHSPPASAIFNGSFSAAGASGTGTAYYTPPHTPGTPKAFATFQAAGSFGPPSAHPDSRGGSHSHFFGSGSRLDYPPSPATARPDPPSTESEALPVFSISTILPNFLFLGPELTEPNHVEELRELGVKRILNIAIECNEDDHGLKLKSRFEKYVKIPMRDTVEEENILKGVREVCDILDDARLHSAATYVHCKAGKSRSVTAVIAYLIHANHWTLSRAYHFVVERRKGVSPNIGFVSELMNFEEQELGGKSTGVQHGGDNGEGGGNEEMSFAGMGMGGLRRGAHIRESLPPLESYSTSVGESQVHGGPMSAGGIQVHKALVGDLAQETEVKDANGRYRHARRAPVDENTLQPLRRVSKAGLESSVFEQRDA